MESTARDNTSDNSAGPTRALNTAASAAHGLVDKLAKPADSLREAAHGAVDKAVQATTPAARWIEEKEHYAEEQLKSTTEYVSENPLKALGIAFLIGVIVGRITG